jgi:hypothetical protein
MAYMGACNSRSASWHQFYGIRKHAGVACDQACNFKRAVVLPVITKAA